MTIAERATGRLFVLTASLALTAPMSLWAQAPAPSGASTGCRAVVDDSGAPVGADLVTWHVRPEAAQRRRHDRQCRTLGPIVLRAEPADRTTAVTRPSLVVIGWNVHVGGGDIEQLLDRLSTSEAEGGSAPDYVLLIEEAYRAGGQIPVSFDAGVRVPRRIAPHPKEHPRTDIVNIARRRGLALYYVPSMRNGKGSPKEDRGNAILSTLRLSDLTAIELPMDRQRRVAISATVQGFDNQSGPWRLRLVTVHLDALVGAKRLWILATGWRDRQARTVLDALDLTDSALVSADLNTWIGGRWESAYRRFAHAWPATQSASTGAAPDAHGRLDFMFFRLPSGWMKTSRRLATPFGSDHRPIVGRIQEPQ
jgi:endonuclease/exonuclease/phosphatase family metal-dependent hydrolase